MPDERPEQSYERLCELGWQAHFEQQIETCDREQAIIARAAAHTGSWIHFFTCLGPLSVPTSLIEAGDDREAEFSQIAVGDWFVLQPPDHRVLRRLERKSFIARKAPGQENRPQLIAANVDTVFIVSSCNQDFNPSRLERYLALVNESQAIPVIILTKADLTADAVEYRSQAESLQTNVLVEVLDARDPQQVSSLEHWCRSGQTVALVGSSGVGKSTLANALGNLELQTNAIREDDARGRHTTTSRSLHPLSSGGWLIDTPGMRELQLPACEEGIAELFQDVIAVARDCKFRDCQHEEDEGCAVQAAIEDGRIEARRLQSYLKLQREQARNSATLAERHQRDRKTGQMYKRIIANKKSRRYGD